LIRLLITLFGKSWKNVNNVPRTKKDESIILLIHKFKDVQ
jgi:hypothetical protein